MKYPTLIVNPPPDFATDAYLEAHLNANDVVICLTSCEQQIHKRRAANQECTAFTSCLGPSYNNADNNSYTPEDFKALKEAIMDHIHGWYRFVTFSERLQRYVDLDYLDHNPSNSRRRSRQSVQGKLRKKAYEGAQVLPTLPQVNRLFESKIFPDGNTAASICRGINAVLSENDGDDEDNNNDDDDDDIILAAALAAAAAAEEEAAEEEAAEEEAAEEAYTRLRRSHRTPRSSFRSVGEEYNDDDDDDDEVSASSVGTDDDLHEDDYEPDDDEEDADTGSDFSDGTVDEGVVPFELIGTIERRNDNNARTTDGVGVGNSNEHHQTFGGAVILYPCVECNRQFRGCFPRYSVWWTSLAELQRDGTGTCQQCYDSFSGASGSHDNEKTEDPPGEFFGWDDDDGQSGDGTPSSSAEAEGRQDYAFDKGQSVWVTQGRTPHLAVYLGNVSFRDGYELVQVQWKSDNSKDFVYPASISAVDFGSSRGRRRRHQEQHPNPNRERAREGAAREYNQIDDDHYDGVADISYEDDENENETSYDSSPSNKAVALSEVESDFHDEFNEQSGNRKQRETAKGKLKGASANTTGNEQRESEALLKEKDAEIKKLEDAQEKRGELTIVPDNPKFDIFFINYHDDDINELLESKDRHIKCLKFRAQRTY